MHDLIIYTDGGARGNPGPAAIGIVIKSNSGSLLKTFGRYIGVSTNNQAEYRALIAALEEAKKMGAERIKCFLDSELLVKQLKREYRVKDKDLQSLFVQAWNLTINFKNVSFNHIPRERNKEADLAVNKALDGHSSFDK
ncbi:MAG: Ribonuclease H [Parcubacteria group bacterium GW2011_GWA2_46_9]|nr:MAG: Ribonuclease H [Parcubacteria group bacterium GW2011_GWA2_46_9]